MAPPPPPQSIIINITLNIIAFYYFFVIPPLCLKHVSFIPTLLPFPTQLIHINFYFEAVLLHCRLVAFASACGCVHSTAINCNHNVSLVCSFVRFAGNNVHKMYKCSQYEQNSEMNQREIWNQNFQFRNFTVRYRN